MNDDDADSMSFIVNRTGPNEEDTITTSFSPSMERMGRLLRRHTIGLSAIIAGNVFFWSWLFGHYHLPWYSAVVILLGVVGVVAIAHNHGMIAGRYEMLRSLSRAKVNVRVVDLNEDGEEE